MEKFTQENEHHLSEKATYAIIIAFVLAYIAFILYREMNGLA